jgi:hypothetical protein
LLLITPPFTMHNPKDSLCDSKEIENLYKLNLFLLVDRVMPIIKVMRRMRKTTKRKTLKNREPANTFR